MNIAQLLAILKPRPFTPLFIPSLVLWHDYFTPGFATISASAFAAVDDRGRNNLDGAQSVSGRRPDLVSSAIDSKRACSFVSANNDSINTTDNAAIQNIFDGGGALAVHINRTTGGTGVRGMVWKGTAGSLGWSLRNSNSTTMRFRIETDATDGVFDFTVTTGAWHTIIINFNASTLATPVIYVDGVSVTVTVTAAPTGTRGSDAGANLFEGNAADNSTNGSDHETRHTMLFSETLTAAQIANLHAYMLNPV